VIIPTKNRPTFLQRALRSAVVQSHRDFEIIVVDDGDGTAAGAAEQIRKRPIRILATKGAGQVVARNLALRNARGRWIAFLDDDDWWADPNHLDDLGAVLTDRSLAYAGGRIVIETDGQRPVASIAFAAFMDQQSVRRDNTLLVPGIAYPLDLHEALGPFDERLPHYWDWDWYLRLAAAGITFRRSRGSGVRVTAHADNVSSASNAARRREDLARLIAKHHLSGVALKNHLSIAMAAANRP
jgi:glycosyltransferase involved in cell wall biosynthesis